MVIKLFVAISLLVLIIPLAAAVETTVEIKTLPNADVSAFVLRAIGDYYLHKSYHANAGDEGIVEFTFDTQEDIVDVWVQIKRFNQLLLEERYEDQVVGKTIEIELPEMEDSPTTTPETTTPAPTVNETVETNQTQDEEEIQEENLTETESETEPTNTTVPITGNVVSENQPQSQSSNFLKYTLYTLGGLLIISLLLFGGVVLAKKRSQSKYGMKPTKLFPRPSGSRNLNKVEEKIKKIDEEIEEIKGEGKVHDAEKRLEQRMHVLENLKKHQH